MLHNSYECIINVTFTRNLDDVGDTPSIRLASLFDILGSNPPL